MVTSTKRRVVKRRIPTTKKKVAVKQKVKEILRSSDYYEGLNDGIRSGYVPLIIILILIIILKIVGFYH